MLNRLSHEVISLSLLEEDVKAKNCLAVFALAGIGWLGSASISSAGPLLDLTSLGYVQYGDAQSYSLPIAGLESTGSLPSPGDEFYVASSPGAIKDLTVVATGTSSNPATSNFAGMDNAYATPSGASGSTFFSTGTYADPGQVGGAFSLDLADTWDANLASFSSMLAGEDAIFFFNNNNENSEGSASQTLAAWMQIWVTDNAGNVISVAPYAPASTGNASGEAVWELTNNNGEYALVSEGGGGVFNGDPTTYQAGAAGSGPYVGTNANTDYVLSGGEICLNAAFAPVSCSSSDVVFGPINHNLGADQAAYGVIFPEFNELLSAMILQNVDLSQLTLHIDLRLGCDPGFDGVVDGSCPIYENFGKDLNNGYEQLFIATASSVPQDVPEPTSLALFGFGLAGVSLFRRRRKI